MPLKPRRRGCNKSETPFRSAPDELKAIEQGLEDRNKLLDERKKQLDAQEAEVKKGLAKLEIKRRRGPVPSTSGRANHCADPGKDEVLFERNAEPERCHRQHNQSADRDPDHRGRQSGSDC